METTYAYPDFIATEGHRERLVITVTLKNGIQVSGGVTHVRIWKTPDGSLAKLDYLCDTSQPTALAFVDPADVAAIDIRHVRRKRKQRKPRDTGLAEIRGLRTGPDEED